MRSGSAATARNGKIDVMPMTWKSACASESEKIAPSFALPYGRERKRTRRIRSATLWINRAKAVPSYTFKDNGTLHLATAGRQIICRKDSGVKDCRTSDPRRIRRRRIRLPFKQRHKHDYRYEISHCFACHDSCAFAV